MTLGERLRKRRQEVGLSQRELARRLGIRHATISDLERGVQKDMSIVLLRRLARTLGVTSDYLIGMYESDDQGTSSPPAWSWLEPSTMPAHAGTVDAAPGAL